MFRVPYRWLPGTFFRNLWSIWTDITGGIRNVIRWTPVIWYDADFDWEYLASIMEYKLRRMGNGFREWGHHVGSDRDARNMLICAELLKRLRADEYWSNSRKRYGRTTLAAKHAQAMQRDEQRYLGKIIGRNLVYWWD